MSIPLPAFHMLRKLAAFILIALCAMVIVSPVEAKKVREFDAGPWAGEVYADDDSGRFVFCAGSASYRSGIDLSVVVNRDYSWAIMLWNEKWNWPDRKNIGARYRFNGGAWIDIDANSDGKSVYLSMPDNDTSVQLFKHSSVMDIRFYDQKVGFNLTKTNDLMAILGGCAEKEVAAEGGTSTPSTEARSGDSSDSRDNSEKKDSDTVSSGTGFFVDGQGHILTNNHVIKGCSSYRVTRTGDIPHPAEVLRTDQTNDLAVLKIDTPSATPYALLKQSGVRVGDQIATFGYPLAGTLSSSGVLTSGNISSLAGMSDDVRHFQISAPIQPGNSGGPLLDMYGNVVGITNMKLNELAAADATGSISQNVNFAIKANVAINFLDAHSIPYEVAPSGQSALPLPDIVEKAKSFTVQITCQ